MYLLAFETANFSCSIAVFFYAKLPESRPELLIFTSITQLQSQSSQIIPALKQTLHQANIDFKMIDMIAVTTGPGSFTGIRIGLAAAYGLQIATNSTLLGISSFEVAASVAAKNNLANNPILVALDSKRQQPYCQFYNNYTKPLTPPFIMSSQYSEDYCQSPLHIIGDGKSSISSFLSDKIYYDDTTTIDASHLGRRALRILPSCYYLYQAQPYYLSHACATK